MAQREQVLDRAQRLQQAFVNNALRNQAGHRLGPYSRSTGLFMRRSYRNYQRRDQQCSPILLKGLIIRQKEPKNLETPIDQNDSFLTPTELFYIRSHFPAPKLELASYQLRIDGAVRNPFVLSYEELRAMPSDTRVATLECAGNGRVFLVPQG